LEADGKAQDRGERRNNWERKTAEKGGDVVFDPFKWLLPANFQ
jgi:hypothetical protein